MRPTQPANDGVALAAGSELLANDEVGRSIISGTRWATIGQVGAQLLRFFLSILLARLLSPSEFGLMTMAWVVIGFVELFKDLGTVSAVVQIKTISTELLNAVFFLNLLIGVLGYLAVFFAAPAVAGMNRQPELIGILRIMAWTLPLSSLGMAKRALLQRELKFGRLAIIDMVAALANGVVAVALALNGFGVWSLVAATLATAAVTTLLLWVYCSWRPSRAFRLHQVKGIAHFSMNVTGSQIFGYLITQADKLLIGVFLGEVALGLYFMAQRLMETVVAFLTAPVTKVLFPAFAGIQEDNQQIGALYSRACGAIALVAFPLVAGLGAVAGPFVDVVLSQKWQSLPPLMVILSVPAVVQSVAMTVSSIYLAKAKAHWLLGWQVSAGAITVLAYLIGLQWGIKGVAAGYALAMLLLVYPAFAIPLRLIDCPPKRFARSLAPYLFATVLMIAVVWGVQLLLRSWRVNSLGVLTAGVLAGGATYVGVIWLMKAPALSDLAEFFLLRRKPPPVSTSAAAPVSGPQ